MNFVRKHPIAKRLAITFVVAASITWFMLGPWVQSQTTLSSDDSPWAIGPFALKFAEHGALISFVVLWMIFAFFAISTYCLRDAILGKDGDDA